MGFAEQRFTTAVDEEFRCPICRDVLDEPITAQCEHVFCRACIHEWLSREQSCPVGRQPLKVHHLQDVTRFFRNYYTKLEICCDFADSGCQFVAKVDEIKAHENQCPFNPDVKTECPNGCTAMVTKKELSAHDCVQYLKNIIADKNAEISRMSDRESDYKRKLLDFQITIKTKNSEINYLNECLFERRNQTSDKGSVIIPSTSRPTASDNNVQKFKLLLVGGKGVGKSSLLTRFIGNAFPVDVTAINGYRSRTIEFDELIIDLEIWENCRQFNKSTDYKEVDGVIFVYDVTKWETFRHLNEFIKDMKRKTRSDVKRLLVGNKCDDIDAKRVDYLSALKFSRLCGIPFIETSAKSGKEVDEAFYRVVTQSVVKLTDLLPFNSAPITGGLQ